MRFIVFCTLTVLLAGCGLKSDADTSYPIDPDDARRQSRGSLTGEGGLTLFGGGRDNSNNGGGGVLPVNAYAWQAALDTVSFMPLASTDPFGGVIISEWYEPDAASAEREQYKMHVLIRDQLLRSDAVQVQVFRKTWKKGEWRNADAPKDMAEKMENIILTRARELRIKQASN